MNPLRGGIHQCMSLPSMDKYEKIFKTHLVQTLGIIYSEFVGRVRHKISFQAP